MALYRTGGGAIGNRDARTIVRLKTTVPYVDAVANFEPASGGADSETMSSLVARAPRALRHGNRAVALEDYADLARSASTEVARVKVVPLRDLRADPLGADRVAGKTSVIVVPASRDVKPTPSVALLSAVEDHLRAHMTPTAAVAAVGPLYVRVDVVVDVALRSIERAGEVEDAVRGALSGFLHPLSGGRDGAGWDFGREPVLSDLYAVISTVPGVDHVRGLGIQQTEELPHALETGRFLVYSGQHHITLGFVGAE
jgi:predicted phage baseplate assembly protein